MKVNSIITLGLLILIIGLQQCKNVEPLIKDEATVAKRLAYEEFVHRIPLQSFDTSILIRDVDIKFQEGESITRMNAIFKFLPGRGILASLQGPLNIEVARIYITQDSLKVIDRMNKTYMTGPFEELISFLRFPFTYEDIPDILLNRYKAHLPNCEISPEHCSSSFELTEQETFHYSYMAERLFSLNQNRYRSLFDYHLYYNAFTYKPIERELWDKRSNTRLNVQYKGEILLDNDHQIPEQINFIFSRNGKKENIEIKYGRVEVSHDRLNFQVPASYTRKDLQL